MKKRKQSRSATSSPRGPVVRRLPLDQLSVEERMELAVSIGEQGRATMVKVLDRLQELTAEVEPYVALATMAFYGMMRSVEEGAGATAKHRELQQGHVEYLQALFLRSNSERDSRKAEPGDIQEFFDLLPQLFEGLHNSRVPSREDSNVAETTEEGALRQVQAYIRMHTSVVRNWGYFSSVKRISSELHAGVDPQFKETFGVSATDMVKFFEHLVRRQEQHANDHMKSLRDVFSHDSIAQQVEAFFARFHFTGEMREFMENLKRDAPSSKALKAVLFPYADIYFTQGLFFEGDRVAEELGLDASSLGNLLEKLSISPGELHDRSPDSLFLDNPVWRQPIIRFGVGSFFCALPQTLMSFVNPVIDNLASKHPPLSQRLSDARSEYLEREVARLFQQAFPKAQATAGYRWRDGNQEFEADLILRFDSTIVLVEAKSGKVSWPALRGAPSRLIEHVRSLIVAPSEQSGRLAARIQQEIRHLSTSQASQLDFPLPLNGVTTVLRLSVCLHDFATVQCVPTMLVQAGILKNLFPLAPCISLADLDVLIDLLEKPHVRLHYFLQRASSYTSQHVIGDELEMLGLYLDTGLCFHSVQPGGQQIFLHGYSDRIDNYYTSRDDGGRYRKPKRATSAWFNRLCEQISRRPFVGWSELTSGLLSISPTRQQELERAVQKMAKHLRQGKTLPNGDDTVVFIGPKWESTALAVRARDSRLKGSVNAGLEELATKVFEHHHLERCVAITVDALSPDLPYMAGALLIRSDRPVETPRFF